MEEIDTGLYRLGNDPRFPSYLWVGGKRVVQVDSGPAFMAPSYRKDIQVILGEGRGPDLLLFTHLHFDHVGGAPYLLRHFPNMVLAGSERLCRSLSIPRILQGLSDLNRSVLKDHPGGLDLLPEDLDYTALRIDLALSDGDPIELGDGRFMEIFATPGHTKESVSYHLPSTKAIFTGEAVGVIPGDRFWVAPEFLSSYEDYLHSILRVQEKRPETILPGHHRAVKGQEVGEFFRTALADCRAFREKIENYLRMAGGNEEEVVQRIKEEEYLPLRQGKQPEKAYLLNLRAQVRLIAKEREREGSG